MATSEQSYTRIQAGDLQVASNFTKLMVTATDKDSMYIKAKESLQDYLDDSDLNTREKAQMLSDLITKLTLAMTTAAMDSAIKISVENRDASYKLNKIHEEILLSMQQRDKIATEMLEIESDIAGKSIRNWKDQAEMYWTTGVDTAGWNPLTAIVLPDNLELETITTGSGYYSTETAKYKNYEILSGAVRNYGTMTFDWNANGTGVASATESGTASWNGLVKQQYNVAVRQEQGFDDNMRQHAANSSANMVGLLVSSDAFSDGSLYSTYLNHWTSSMNYLNETV